MGVSKSLVYDPHNIIGLVSQRLVRRLCPHCKVPLIEVIDKLERRVDERIRSAGVNLHTAYVLGEGCEHCNHRGVVDREVVAEVVRTDHVFMEHLLQGKKMEALQHLRSQMKVETMIAHALGKINAGIVCPLDAERFVGNLDADVTWRDFKIDMDEITRGHGDLRYELQ
jgi:type II secretory ATPase GspE/PulE/Tfp pilus assembly ATPase PilB-like protein